ncbi:MAG: hypothetical protein ABI056_05915, partial [Caulobacteraceae bacterium]
ADGLLSIDLKRELPEALKPRRIEIGGKASSANNDTLIEAANTSKAA